MYLFLFVSEEERRPLLDTEAVTTYKLKGPSSNVRTDQGSKNRELVRPDGLASRPIQLKKFAVGGWWVGGDGDG